MRLFDTNVVQKLLLNRVDRNSFHVNAYHSNVLWCVHCAHGRFSVFSVLSLVVSLFYTQLSTVN